jgi:hypothetical protein
MKNDKIQALISKKEKEIIELRSKLTESGNWVWVEELKLYVEKDVHDKGKSWNDLKEKYGKNFEKMLLTRQQVEVLDAIPNYRRIFKMRTLNNDFFIQQYNEDNKKRGYVADFYAGAVGSGFYSGGSPADADSCRGVRFCRKKIKGAK